MSVLPVATGRQTWAGLRRSTARHRPELVAAVLWTLLASVAVVTLPLLLGRLVDASASTARGTCG